MAPRDGVVLLPIASKLHDPRSTARVVSVYRKWLAGYYDTEAAVVTSAADVTKHDPRVSAAVLCLVLTGGTEQILRAVASMERPLLVLAHESMNSLPAALEAMSSQPIGATRLVFGRGKKQIAEVSTFVSAVKTLSRIRTHKVGLIGGPSSWLTYSLPDAEQLQARLGVRVVEIPMKEFGDAHSSAKDKGHSATMIRVLTDGSTSEEVTRTDLEKSEMVYRALRALAGKYGLSSVSPRCFDFIKDYGATGCIGLSKLNDEGIVAGCEGDIPSTVGMIVMQETSGRPAFMGNPSFIAGHRIVLAHCTVARSLVGGVRFRSHFESGKGVALAGEFEKGARVTVLRFARGYGLLRAGAGRIMLGKPWSEDLCRTQVDIRMDGDAEVFLRRPIGNHLVMTYGDHVDALNQMASVAGIEFEQV